MTGTPTTVVSDNEFELKQVKNNIILNADELIKSLGKPDIDNEYIIKPDKNGIWWLEHKHVGSGEPLRQWLTGNPLSVLCLLTVWL